MTVFRNGRIVSMTRRAVSAEADAIAVAGGRILAVGREDAVAACIGPDTHLIDLGGRTVLPGFIDCHVHFIQTGLSALGPSAYDIASADEVLDILDRTVRQAGAGEPVLIYGCALRQLDRRLTRFDCDRVAPRSPVLVADPGGHMCLLNTLASLAYPIAPDTHGVEVDASTGQPTGHLAGRANRLARFHWFSTLSDDVRRRACHAAAAKALETGVTTVHALDGGSAGGHGRLPEADIEILLDEQGRLPTRLIPYYQSTRVERAAELGLTRIGGCLCLDGAYSDHTAAFLEPYADEPSTRGILYFSDQELDDFVGRAHRAGMQISMHAIGDGAIEQLLNAYERALERDPRPDHRHRIEHFSGPTPSQIERAARLGVAVSMQPNYAYVATGRQGYSPAALRFMGPDRYARRHPYRNIYDAGVLLAGGSNSDGKPIWPLFGVHALVNHPDQERRLDAFGALTLYTTHAAAIAHEERDKGTIEAGKLADFAVLDRDPLTAEPATLKDIRADMTIVGGEIVYTRQ